jgi:FkbM family methyltransferase
MTWAKAMVGFGLMIFVVASFLVVHWEQWSMGRTEGAKHGVLAGGDSPSSNKQGPSSQNKENPSPPLLPSLQSLLAREHWSQNNEDHILLEKFHMRKRNGFYMEMGALDGRTYSNTLFFQHNLDWTGLLIEADPQSIPKLQQNRPNNLQFHGAVCEQTKTLHWLTGSAAVSGIYEYMDPVHVKAWHAGAKVEDMIKIQCKPLSAILASFKISHIDFFSLDVEGAELEVLKTFPFDSVCVDVIFVEASGFDKKKEKQVRDLLIQNGYMLIGQIMYSDWFVGKAFQEKHDWTELQKSLAASKNK